MMPPTMPPTSAPPTGDRMSPTENNVELVVVADVVVANVVASIAVVDVDDVDNVLSDSDELDC